MPTQISCSWPTVPGPHHAVVPVVVLPHPLAAAGEDAAVAAGGLDHDPPFADGERFRLLAVDVLAVAHRLASDQGVPVVGRGAEHGVDVRASAEVAEIAVVGAALEGAAGPLLGVAVFGPPLGRQAGRESTSQTATAWTSANPMKPPMSPEPCPPTPTNPMVIRWLRRSSGGAAGRGRDEIGGRRNGCRCLEE